MPRPPLFISDSRSQSGRIKQIANDLDRDLRIRSTSLVYKKLALATSISGWDYYFALKTMDLFLEATDEHSIAPSLLMTCKDWGDFELSDAIYYKVKFVQPSWQSVHFVQEVGLGVTAHEVGHLIKKLSEDRSVTFDDLENVKSNSRKLHSELGENPESYVDEDWSDFYSGIMLNALMVPTNYFCTMIPLNKEKTDYENMSLINESLVDNHSSSLLRLVLLEKMLKGGAPKICENIRE